MHYGIDLRVAVDSEPPRRLWALLQGLPPDAVVWHDQPQSWTLEKELLALLVEIQSQGKVSVPRPDGVRQAPQSGGGSNVVSMQEYLSKFSDRVEGG